MNQGNIRPSYNEIKEYIRAQLKNSAEKQDKNNPIVSFNSATREVFIRAFNHNLDEIRKVYVIPNPKEDAVRFRETWVDIFMGCLDYYKQKLRKEGIVVTEYVN